VLRILRSITPTIRRNDAIYYRKLTDASVAKDTMESRQEPILMPVTITADMLAKGVSIIITIYFTF
jgi:hypothetical protein